jgi:HPt (histidine-containing phosphotransfer) domain-containing protein
MRPPRPSLRRDRPEIVTDYRTFDQAALLEKLGGDREFVRSLLGVALRSNGNLPTELRNASAAADFATLARLAHKVKGTAGDLVAVALQSRAREAELAARASDPDAIGLNLELADTLDELLDELRSAAARSD